MERSTPSGQPRNHECARRLAFAVTDGGFADFMDTVEYEPGDSLKVWDRSAGTFRTQFSLSLNHISGIVWPRSHARVAPTLTCLPSGQLVILHKRSLGVKHSVCTRWGPSGNTSPTGIDEINSSAQAVASRGGKTFLQCFGFG